MTRWRQGETWAVVLAGGEGKRLREFTRQRFGRPMPKQYCAFIGGRTMLEHTLDRAEGLASPHRTVTIVGRGHTGHFDAALVPGYVVEQPRNCDTGPGLLLALSVVLAHDPRAVVVVLPSDHFVRPLRLFEERVRVAIAAAERLRDRVVLCGARADGPETEYGWIQPGSRLAETGARAVLGFHEKPDRSRAEVFHERGYLWNTFIMAARAEALWALARGAQPALVERFEELRARAAGELCSQALVAAYDGMPALNFSSHILERSCDGAAVVALDGVEWDDWGRPERIERAARRLAGVL